MIFMVTCGLGFIGSHIVDALAAYGCTAIVFDNLSSGKRKNLKAEVKLARGDVRDVHAVDTALSPSADTVFHLAAQIDVRRTIKDPAADMQVNVGGTINVLQRYMAAGVSRFLMFLTGGALYGEPPVLPATEETTVWPLSPFGAPSTARSRTGRTGYRPLCCGMLACMVPDRTQMVKRGLLPSLRGAFCWVSSTSWGRDDFGNSVVRRADTWSLGSEPLRRNVESVAGT